MDEKACPFNMTQKRQPQPCSPGGAFDDSRDVGNDKGRGPFSFNHPQIGNKSGERIVCNLWPGGGNPGEKGRLSSVRKSNDSHIGKKLEFELQMPFLPFPSFFSPTGSTVGRCGKPRIPSSSPSPFRYHKPLAIEKEVLQKFSDFLVPHKGPHRDPDNEVQSVSACLIFAFTVDPFAGSELFRVS
jgi:hypothetical protein